MEKQQANHQLDSVCPQCSATNISFNKNYGFYTCNACGHVWGYSKDDPDYDEVDEDVEQLN